MNTAIAVCPAFLFLIFLRIYLNIKKTHHVPRRFSGERFWEAFREELQDLSQGAGNPAVFLEHAFRKHETAYLDFRSHLKGHSLKKFDQAWKEYSNGGPGSFLVPYSANGDIEIAREKRALAADRIRRLLSFAR